jgi:hypothetical protein
MASGARRAPTAMRPASRRPECARPASFARLPCRSCPRTPTAARPDITAPLARRRPRKSCAPPGRRVRSARRRPRRAPPAFTARAGRRFRVRAAIFARKTRCVCRALSCVIHFLASWLHLFYWRRHSFPSLFSFRARRRQFDGTANPCAAGTYCPQGQGAAGLFVCQPGTFCPVASANYTQCTSGSYCPTANLGAATAWCVLRFFFDRITLLFACPGLVIS